MMDAGIRAVMVSAIWEKQMLLVDGETPTSTNGD